MDEAAQRKACQTAKLFSRVEPAHKSKIVDYLQKDGAVAAMVRESCGYDSLDSPSQHVLCNAWIAPVIAVASCYVSITLVMSFDILSCALIALATPR